MKQKKEEVNILKRDFTLSRFKDSNNFELTPISFINNLTDDSISIISEIKKASPSKGIIREDFNHTDIAKQYMDAGTSAISIITDKNYFQGDIKYLEDISSIKNAPLLRKDFLIDEYQVYEAKSFGADFILLISEILSADQIEELTQCAHELGMEVLLELHSDSQLQKIDFSLNNLIGINNRNLEDFSVDLKTTASIKKQLPSGVFVISESGINTRDNIDELTEYEINGILVGEHLMRQSDIYAALKELREWCQ